MVVVPLLLLFGMFAVVAVVSVAVVRGLLTNSVRKGLRLLLVQCMAFVGAGIGFVAAWIAHATVLADDSGIALWHALLGGTLGGALTGALCAALASRVPAHARTAGASDALLPPAGPYDERTSQREE